MTEEDKKKLAQSLLKMEKAGESEANIKMFVSAFNKKNANKPTKTAQDFGRQPIDVSKKDTSLLDYGKSAVKGAGAGMFQFMGNVANAGTKVLPDTGKGSGYQFLKGAKDVLHSGAETLRGQNMEQAVKKRNPALYGGSNVGELAGEIAINPLNQVSLGSKAVGLGTNLALRGARGGVNAIAGSLERNPEIDQGSPLTQAGVDFAAGALLPAGAADTASKVKAVQTSSLDKATELAGKILQGDTKSRKKGLSSLSSLDLKDVKTYEDLHGAVSDKIGGLSKKMDTFVDKNYTDKVPVKSLDNVRVLDSGEILERNYVTEALGNLDEFYTGAGDLNDATRIKNFINKVQTEGITKNQINQIAREYGQSFGEKAFTKLGDPKTSVSAQAYEATRKGLKNEFRKDLPEDIVEYDKKMSDLFNSKKFIEKNVENTNKLMQKIKDRGLIEKLSRLIGRGIDIASLGSIRGLFTSFLPSNIGNKVMNSLDMQEALSKNLKQFIKEIKKAGVKSDLPELKALERSLKVVSDEPKIPSAKDLYDKALYTEQALKQGKVVGPDFVMNRPAGVYNKKVLETNTTTGTPKEDIGDLGRLTQARLDNVNKKLPNIDSGKAGIEIENPKAKKLGVTDKVKLAKKLEDAAVEAKKYTLDEFLEVYKLVSTKRKLTNIWKKANDVKSVAKSPLTESRTKKVTPVKEKKVVTKPKAESSLIQEAKKYDSVEEFVKAQGEGGKKMTVYRTSKSGKKHKDIKDFTFFSPNKESVKQYLREGDKIIEYKIPEIYLEKYGKTNEYRYIPDSRNKNIRELTDIWNKANKK